MSKRKSATSTKPLVSILCITYNHGRYIAQTIESFLAQKLEGEIEIIIHDDASTDNTVEIIMEFQEKYPGIITLQTEEQNQFSRGSLAFMENIYTSAKGKYLTWCEGDDYWTDPHKLQAQVDYMEQHPASTVCFHPVEVKQEKAKDTTTLYPLYDGTEFSLERLVRENYIQTNSVMYRRQSEYKNQVPSDIVPLDWYMHIFHGMKGDIGFINKPMAVYRKHKGSVWWRTKESELAFWDKQLGPHMRMHESVMELVRGDKKLEAAALLSAVQNSTQFYAAMERHSALEQARVFAREYTDFNTQLIWSKLRTVDEQVIQIDKLNKDLHVRGTEAKMLNEEIVRLRKRIYDLRHPVRLMAKKSVANVRKIISRLRAV